jgi:hypothetical protein
MTLRKWIASACIIGLLASSGSAFASSVTPIVENTTVQAEQTVSDADVQEQINKAARLVEEEEKKALEAKFQAMAPQEKYDYLVPSYLEELRMLYSQMVMMHEQIMTNRSVGDINLDSFDYKIQSFKKSLDKLGQVGAHQFDTTQNLYQAADSIQSMNKSMMFISTFVGGYNDTDVNMTKKYSDQYDTYDKAYNDYYTKSFEFYLMREFDIKIDKKVNRYLQESIIAHNNNIEAFEEALNGVIECGESYAKGKSNSDLFRKATDAESLGLSLKTDDPASAFGGYADEHPELTPLAYDTISKIKTAAEKTKMFTYDYKGKRKKESKKAMEEAQSEASSALSKFKKECKEAMKTAEQIDQNILKNVAEVKAKREETAKANGYNSWFQYQLALEQKAEEAKNSKIMDQASELAVEQKKIEEERRARAQAAYEKKMRERVDFSKALSQQNYNKKFYMQKSQERLESTFGQGSGWVELGMVLDSDAFDQLFQIRSNGGDIETMQQLFDQNPFEFATILRLYRSYQ